MILAMLLLSVAKTHRNRWTPALTNFFRWTPAPTPDRVPGD